MAPEGNRGGEVQGFPAAWGVYGLHLSIRASDRRGLVKLNPGRGFQGPENLRLPGLTCQLKSRLYRGFCGDNPYYRGGASKLPGSLGIRPSEARTVSEYRKHRDPDQRERLPGRNRPWPV